MTKKRHKELKDRLSGLDYDFEPSKKHIKITIRAFGRERKLTASSSPSCSHSLNAFERDLKKVMYELENEFKSGTTRAKN